MVLCERFGGGDGRAEVCTRGVGELESAGDLIFFPDTLCQKIVVPPSRWFCVPASFCWRPNNGRTGIWPPNWKPPLHCGRLAAPVHPGASGRVQQLWQANDWKPDRVRTFKLSKHPQFEAKFSDVIGLYLHPPQRALVLCCDEKSQCQALERTQPGLPLGLGHTSAPAPMTMCGTAPRRCLPL